jgi:multidrug efflux pump subunit AcrA (membrane-fusion protein)
LTFVTGCSLVEALQHRQEKTETEAPLPTVRAEVVAVQRIEDPVLVAGDVVSSVRLAIAAKSGGRVERVLKRLGDKVQEGEPIARLRSDEAIAARDRAAADVELAMDELRTARSRMESERRALSVDIRKLDLAVAESTRQLNKRKNDFDGGLATKAEVDQAALQLETLRIDLGLAKRRLSALDGAEATAAAEQRVEDAELALRDSEKRVASLDIPAPTSGIISGLTVVEGSEIEAGESVGSVDKVDPVRIVAWLSEEAASLVQGRTELTYAWPESEERHAAPIRHVAGVMDESRKAYELSLEVANPPAALKPGEKVSVQLTEDEAQSAVALPHYSVLGEANDRYVFVLDGDVARKRSVELGRSNSYYYEALSGVAPGDRVVVAGLDGLRDGVRVVASGGEEAEMEAGASE